MSEYLLSQLFVGGVCLIGAGCLGTMAYRGYKGRWRAFLTMQPWLVPVGRYWGLLTSALWSACCVWVGISGCFILWFNYHHYNLGPTQSFMLTSPFIFVVGAAGFLFSWWLPRRWRPQWLLDLDRTTDRDAPSGGS